MATVQRYVNTASAGGDGTTNGAAGATAAYASLASWELNEGGSATDDYIVDCCGTAADTAACTVDFSPTITTGSITIRANRSDAAGFYDGNLVHSTSHYRLVAGSGGTAALTAIAEPKVTVDGLQIEDTGGNFGGGVKWGANGSIKNNRILNSGTGYAGIGRGNSGGGAETLTIENNLIVGFLRGVELICNAHTNTVVTVRHNTIYGPAGADVAGIVVNGASKGAASVWDLIIKGNAIANHDAGDAIVITAWDATGTQTYADNAIDNAEGTTDEIALGTTTDAWTSPGTTAASDFTIKDTASTLYNAVNPTLVTEDITGFTRDGTNHDVGCFELQAGGGNTTITAEPGSFSITGTAASLLEALRLVADPGSVAITGTAASLERGKRITAAPGAFSITGTDAALTVDRRLTAEAGSVAITGTPASLLEDKKIVAEPGSFTITGTDATLTEGRHITMVAAPGAFDILGTNANFLRDRRMVADSGSILITGSDMTPIHTLAPGSQVLDGSGLRIIRRLRRERGLERLPEDYERERLMFEEYLASLESKKVAPTVEPMADEPAAVVPVGAQPVTPRLTEAMLATATMTELRSIASAYQAPEPDQKKAEEEHRRRRQAAAAAVLMMSH